MRDLSPFCMLHEIRERGCTRAREAASMRLLDNRAAVAYADYVAPPLPRATAAFHPRV